jgi:Icc protein
VSAPGEARFRFVHLTDTHIMVGGKWRPRSADFEFDTEASLRRVVATVRTLEPAPAFAVLGGDLASPDLLRRERPPEPDEWEVSYRRLAEILAELPCPAHFLIGNHDHRGAFNRVLRPDAPSPDAPHYYAFDHDGYHFVALDSQEPGLPGGFVDPAQLDWLARDLARHRDRATVVFVHHHPWPLGLRWIDTMRVRNGDELMTLLAGHPQVRWVVCGHVHLDQAIQSGPLTMLTTPSTCIQMSKVSQAGKALPGPPGFRVIDVAGGVLSTRVMHLREDGASEL